MSLQAKVQGLLGPFADPATELSIVAAGDGVLFRFLRNGEERQGRIVEQLDGSLRVTPSGGTPTSVSVFLASEQMADLDRFARVQIAQYERRTGSAHWISGPAQLDGQRASDSLEAISDAVRAQSGRTTVAILDAPAGMGKTSLVEHMSYMHAKEFARRSRTNLTLIISSRGRRLSRLNDAIAATLQDLRAGLFYQEVPVLVRQGLLNLVIDGFDELVNQDGYDDAWSSLGDLIDSIAGGGVLILSSRDTFFSDQQFVQRAHRGDELLASRLSFRFVRLLPWSRAHIKQFFEGADVPAESSQDALRFFDSSHAESLGRPFFIKHIAEALREDRDLDPDRILPLIIESFVVREARLLFGIDCRESDRAQLERFFSELASEMRVQERDWLELDVVQFFLDAVLQEGEVPEEHRRQLVHRAGAVAFLERIDDSRSSRRSFPHQLVRDAFFARGLLRLVVDQSAQIESMLKLGIFGLDLCEVVVALADTETPPTPKQIHWLLDLCAGRSAGDIIAMNAAALAFALCRIQPDSGDRPFQVRNLYLGHVSLAHCDVPSMRVRESSFGLLDLVDASCTQLDLDDSVQILQARLSSATKLGVSWRCYPQVVEYLSHQGEVTVLRSPDQVRGAVDSCRELGTISENHLSQSMSAPGAKLLERLARRWVRRFYLHELDHKDEPAFADPLWPALRELLDKYGRLERKTPATSRPQRQLLHLRDPRRVLAGQHQDVAQDEEIKALWREVALLS